MKNQYLMRRSQNFSFLNSKLNRAFKRENSLYILYEKKTDVDVFMFSLCNAFRTAADHFSSP